MAECSADGAAGKAGVIRLLKIIRFALVSPFFVITNGL
jgi:hypothetical protein